MSAHFHVYRAHRDPHRGCRIFATTRTARYESRQAAQKAAAKAEPDKRMRMVLHCSFDRTDCPSKDPIDIAERRNDR